MSRIRGVFKLSIFALLVIAVVPTQGLILLITKGRYSYHLPRLWHAIVSRVIGIRYKITGTPYESSQSLYMSNHISYLDIPLIGGIFKCAFVAKSDVESWPLFGFLAKLQQTAFIKRERNAARQEKNALQKRISAGESLIIFPEGTSTDGQAVIPFKSKIGRAHV